MRRSIALAGAVLAAGLMREAAPAAIAAAGAPAPALVRIESVEAAGRPAAWRPGEELRLGSSPGNLIFHYGPSPGASRTVLRLRHKLEGRDTAWQEGGGEMFLAVRFLDAAGEQAGQTHFFVHGQSAGWTGTLAAAPLTHRRETVTVPPGTALLQLVISSAGPPATIGVFVVDDLVVSRRPAGNGPSEVVLRAPFCGLPGGAAAPQGWMRDGSRPSMAQLVELGRNPAGRAFAVCDEDPFGHGEWHSLREGAPKIVPGEQLMVEWNEAYSIGLAGHRVAVYENLPQGRYRFRVEEATALGVSAGPEASLEVGVPPAFYRRPWFWGVMAAGAVLLAAAAGRYLSWRRMRRRMVQLKQERLVERERLRIAQNIHDDLGARVTQISLLSGMAQANPKFPAEARAEFDRVSTMSRELVAALYETVWSVSPENDNLDALGGYLCQMAGQLCAQGPVRCRLRVGSLPRDTAISSQARHQIVMTVKEALHNVLKHAGATEVVLRAEFAAGVLAVGVEDNGRGFDTASAPAGNGLANMQRRMAGAGGACAVARRPGGGTQVDLRLPVGTEAGAPRNTR